MDFGHLGRNDATARLYQRRLLPLADRAGVDSPHGDSPHVVGPVERGHEHLKRRVGFHFRTGNRVEHHLDQRPHRIAANLRVVRGIALLAAGEDVRQLAEHLVGAQIHKQVECLVEHLVRSSVATVDLVDHDDRLEAELHCLGKHEPRLRQGAFGGIDQHERPVGHPQHSLHLAAEIGVAGRVDEIDFHTPVVQGDVLCQDRDSTLAFEIVGIEDAVAHQLGRPKLAALTQKAIDQRRLAVVDVGDDGNISNIAAAHENSSEEGH